MKRTSSSSSIDSEYSTCTSSSNNNSSEESAFNIDLSGDTVNRYNVIVELGHGSYSIVWLVYCVSDNKYYAMKVQNPEDYDEGIEEINTMKRIPKNEPYINCMIESFIETRMEEIDGELKELKFVCSIYELCCGNLDGLARKGKYQKGYEIPVVKKMLKQICLGLQSIHNKLKGFHGDIKPDNILLCGLNNRDQQYIKLYEEANFPSLYIKVKKEYMDEKNITTLSKQCKLRIRKNLHRSIVEMMPKVEESMYEVNEDLVINPSIRITDFGFFCHKDEKFNESFGTRYYQSPENILYGSCDEKVDIWAVGCMLFELATGTILFDPQSDERGSTDFHHLEMIINLCNEFSPKYLSSMKYSSTFFNKKGKLDNIIYSSDFNTATPIKINNKLKEFNVDDEILADLLTQMLTLESNKRISVHNILNHKWLK
jgi:serine/threonine-protein kinase SRPK3